MGQRLAVPVGCVLFLAGCRFGYDPRVDPADAGDAATRDADRDAAPGVDAGPDAAVDAGMDAAADAGTDAATDAGPGSGTDAGTDSGPGTDSGSGLDAGTDAGTDAGSDAGTVTDGGACRTIASVSASGPRASAMTCEHTCAVAGDGTLLCWGCNADGQLGLGATAVGTNETAPRVVGTASFQQVEAGRRFTCGIDAAGALRCWGDNQYGTLGDGTTTDRPSPVAIAPGSTWSQTCAGRAHACAIRSDGALFCWGEGGEGALGLGTNDDSHVPARVGTAIWERVSCGAGHTCGLRTDGSAWCWGRNDHGQLGNGTSGVPAGTNAPSRVGTDTDWIDVSAGGDHSCGIRSPGNLWCWGWKDALGTGSVWDETTPVRVGTASDYTAVSASEFHSCAARADGTMWCWGFQSSGRLGDPSVTSGLHGPREIGAGVAWNVVSAATDHSCALDDGGGLWCWGANAQGQLGLGDTTVRDAPTAVCP